MAINKENYEKMINVTPELLCITDTDGNFRFVNPAFVSLIGYTPNEMMGLNIFSIIHPEDVLSVKSKLKELLYSKNGKFDFEYRFKCKDGAYKWISWNMITDWDEKLVYSAGRDTTERKMFEESLKKSEQRYKQLTDLTTEGIVIFSTDGRIADVNQRLCELFGYEADELVGSNIMKYITPEYHADAIKRLGGTVFRQPYYYCVLRKDGEKRFVEGIADEIYHDGKKYRVSVLRDITAKRQAEDSLKATKARLLEAQKFACLGYWEVNPVTRECIWSDEIKNMLGFNPQECDFSFDLLINLVHPDDRHLVIDANNNLMHNEEPELDYRIIRPDGKLIWVFEKVGCDYDETGKLSRIHGILQDITERKLNEAKLKESEERFRELAENMGEVLWINTSGQITYINPAYEKIWGNTCQSLYDNPDSFINSIHPDDKERVKEENARNNPEQGVSFSSQYRIVRPDGTIRWVWSRLFPICDENGKVVRSIGIADDITIIKEYEASLKNAKEAAELANKAKSQFLANMSHEIRTPMNGILGMAQLLGMGLKGEEKEMADIIRVSGNRLLNIINDILDLSKIEVGKVRLSHEEFNIHSLVDEISKFIQTLTDQKGLEYKTSIDKEIQGVLIGDSDRLRQVLLNLLGNAVKFTQSGSIELTVSRGKIIDDRVQLVFSVKDTGIGISEGKIGELFTAFMQADDSFSKKYGGTGLGLAISKQLVNMMGGDIWVESKLGVGSNFLFTAFFTSKTGMQGAQANGAEEAIGVDPVNAEVLLVEDDNVSGLVLQKLCERKNIKVTIAASGEQALEILETVRFDIIFMDVQMPDLSGYETTAIIREREKSLAVHTPIIATTAFALEGAREKCLAAGMDDYLEKPLNAERFYSVLAKYIPQKLFDANRA